MLGFFGMLKRRRGSGNRKKISAKCHRQLFSMDPSLLSLL
jgi:hypothetical protein